jgi:phosphotransferase system  glucose/maltose/N-acetylglucosamine-specific IIC component
VDLDNWWDLFLHLLGVFSAVVGALLVVAVGLLIVVAAVGLIVGVIVEVIDALGTWWYRRRNKRKGE